MKTLPNQTLPVEHNDPINARILAISEDKIAGFVREPFAEIAERAGLPVETVLERIIAMLRAGTIRRVRQTLLATNLADGALVAWKVPPEKIDAAFDWMSQRDPFSGHVVLRSTDAVTPGSDYKLWTTLKVPQGFSMQRHCEFLLNKVGADHFRIMPAKRLFVLGVGHLRRRGMEPGSMPAFSRTPSSRSSTAAGTCRWPSARFASTASWKGSSPKALERDQPAARAVMIQLDMLPNTPLGST